MNLWWRSAKIGDVYESRRRVAAKNCITEYSATLLDHQIQISLPLISIVYVILQAAVGLHHTYSSTPICNHSDDELSWAKYMMSGSSMCMVLTCTLQLIRMRQLLKVKENSRNLPLIRVFLVLFVMCAISGSSHLMTLLWQYGGICKDAFGVYSPAAQWAEWLVLVPYLCYIALALEQKSHMSKFDSVMVGLLLLMIMAGFSLNIPMPFGVAIFLLLVCWGCLGTVTCMTVWNYRKVERECGAHKLRLSGFFLLKQRKRKAHLLRDLLIIMWYFPTVWLLGAAGALDLNYTFAAYEVGSIFGKVIFSTVVVESHTQLLFEYLLTAASRTKDLREDDSTIYGSSGKDSAMMSRDSSFNRSFNRDRSFRRGSSHRDSSFNREQSFNIPIPEDGESDSDSSAEASGRRWRFSKPYLKSWSPRSFLP